VVRSTSGESLVRQGLHHVRITQAERLRIVHYRTLLQGYRGSGCNTGRRVLTTQTRAIPAVRPDDVRFAPRVPPMRVPDYESLMRPSLEALADGAERTTSELQDLMAAAQGVTDDEREVLIPGGKQPVFSNRVGWAITYLVKARLVRRPRRAVAAITERGKQLLVDGATCPTLAHAESRTLSHSVVSTSFVSVKYPRSTAAGRRGAARG
jgi:Mrr N-terminal domain